MGVSVEVEGCFVVRVRGGSATESGAMGQLNCVAQKRRDREYVNEMMNIVNV